MLLYSGFDKQEARQARTFSNYNRVSDGVAERGCNSIDSSVAGSGE